MLSKKKSLLHDTEKKDCNSHVEIRYWVEELIRFLFTLVMVGYTGVMFQKHKVHDLFETVAPPKINQKDRFSEITILVKDILSVK